MVEKPLPQDAPSNLAIIGRYLLPPEIFEILAATASDVGGEIQLTSALKTLLARHPIDGYLFEGRRYDAGERPSFLPRTQPIRDSSFTIAPLPADLQDRRVEITVR